MIVPPVQAKVFQLPRTGEKIDIQHGLRSAGRMPVVPWISIRDYGLIFCPGRRV